MLWNIRWPFSLFQILSCLKFLYIYYRFISLVNSSSYMFPYENLRRNYFVNFQNEVLFVRCAGDPLAKKNRVIIPLPRMRLQIPTLFRQSTSMRHSPFRLGSVRFDCGRYQAAPLFIPLSPALSSSQAHALSPSLPLSLSLSLSLPPTLRAGAAV